MAVLKSETKDLPRLCIRVFNMDNQIKKVLTVSSNKFLEIFLPSRYGNNVKECLFRYIILYLEIK